MDKQREIVKYSNPQIVKKNLIKYFNSNIPLYLSSRKDKKYMIQDPNGKWIHFGQMQMFDFTKHQDEERRQRYLKRATNIKGNWKDNKYSPNNLSIWGLWQ
jgi:hypothetical protein